MKKNILLAVTGLSPQVVTETIYALHLDGKEIDEVQIITTKTGKEQAWLGLGIGDAGKKGQLARLVEDYNLPPIHFTEDSIEIVPDADGNLVDDARTIDDQYALADFITNKVRVLTQDKNNQIFASLAGGRKTMTFFLGYAMSLFGRERDRLSHVLVDAEYEGIPDFFYPTPYDKTVRNRNGQAFNAQKAKVQLTDIPYVRMREELPKAIMDQGESYCRTIEKMNLANEKPSLEIDYETKSITASGIKVEMANAEFTFYTWFIEDLLTDGKGFSCPNEIAPDEDYAEKYLAHYEENSELNDKVKDALQDGMTKSYFSERKSRVKKALSTALGNKLAKAYCLDKRNKTNIGTCFSLSVNKEDISIQRRATQTEDALESIRKNREKFGSSFI